MGASGGLTRFEACRLTTRKRSGEATLSGPPVVALGGGFVLPGSEVSWSGRLPSLLRDWWKRPTRGCTCFGDSRGLAEL